MSTRPTTVKLMSLMVMVSPSMGRPGNSSVAFFEPQHHHPAPLGQVGGVEKRPSAIGTKRTLGKFGSTPITWPEELA